MGLACRESLAACPETSVYAPGLLKQGCALTLRRLQTLAGAAAGRQAQARLPALSSWCPARPQPLDCLTAGHNTCSLDLVPMAKVTVRERVSKFHASAQRGIPAAVQMTLQTVGRRAQLPASPSSSSGCSPSTTAPVRASASRRSQDADAHSLMCCGSQCRTLPGSGQACTWVCTQCNTVCFQVGLLAGRLTS